MKQCLALAVVACLAASGCSSTSFWKGSQPNHVTTSQTASRPTIMRDFRKGGPELGVKLAAFNDSCTDASCGCETGCGCAVDGSGACVCGAGGCGAGGGLCRGLINGVAGGWCGNGCNACGGHGCGLCGGGGGLGGHHSYPENPTFNQGPPVGQVAYPYYTVKGPRDFLLNNPPSVGPY
jgi:hypothetical protein